MSYNMASTTDVAAPHLRLFGCWVMTWRDDSCCCCCCCFGWWLEKRAAMSPALRSDAINDGDYAKPVTGNVSIIPYRQVATNRDRKRERRTRTQTSSRRQISSVATAGFFPQLDLVFGHSLSLWVNFGQGLILHPLLYWRRTSTESGTL